MFGLIFFTLVTFSFGEPQSNITFVTSPDNPYMQLFTNDSDYPTQIALLQDINPDTQLMSRIIYPEEDVTPGSMSFEDSRLNLCDILDIESNDPIISEWQYLVRYALGLQGERCPIEKGIRPIEPSFFSDLPQTSEPDFGRRFFIIRIEHFDQPLESDPIMELRAHLNRRNGTTLSNQTDTENSSSIVSFSMLIPSIIIALFVTKFIK